MLAYRSATCAKQAKLYPIRTRKVEVRLSLLLSRANAVMCVSPTRSQVSFWALIASSRKIGQASLERTALRRAALPSMSP